MRRTAAVIALVFFLFLATATPTFVGVKADDSEEKLVEADDSDEKPEGCAASKLDINVYVERENLVLAVGEDAIHSHDFTRDIFKIAWKSDGLRDLRKAFEADGYEIVESRSLVLVNTAQGGAIVALRAVLETDPEVSERLIAVVDVQQERVVGTLLGSEVQLNSHVACTCFFGWCFCVDYCELLAAFVIANCVVGCAFACCYFVPPACFLCGRACLICGAGFGYVYDWCVGWWH